MAVKDRTAENATKTAAPNRDSLNLLTNPRTLTAATGGATGAVTSPATEAGAGGVAVVVGAALVSKR